MMKNDVNDNEGQSTGEIESEGVSGHESLLPQGIACILADSSLIQMRVREIAANVVRDAVKNHVQELVVISVLNGYFKPKNLLLNKPIFFFVSYIFSLE